MTIFPIKKQPNANSRPDDTKLTQSVSPQNNWPDSHMLVFIHIPKTGGTSLTKIISSSNSHKNIVRIQNPDDIYYIKDRELNEADMLTGHYGFGLLRRIKRPQIRLTQIRHPVDRVISLYYFHRHMAKGNEPKGSDRYYASKYSLKEFLNYAKNWGPLHCATHNTQTWQLFKGRYLPTRNKHRRLNSKEILTTAINNLNTFDVVGFQDAFPNTLDKLKRLINLNTKEIPKEKAIPNRPKVEEISPEIINTIENMNRLDLELYHYAKAKY